MQSTCHSLCVLPLLLLAPASAAQQFITDIEPNHTKELATPAIDLVDGDMLVAFGFGGCGAGPPDVDYFRARTLALPPGIYRHDLVHAGSSSNELRLVGLDAIQDQVIPGSYDYLQTVDLSIQPGQFLTWYGFGKSEEVYVDLFASYSCRSVISTVLQTTPVTPIDLGNVSSVAGQDNNLSLSVFGVTSPLDLEIQVFDSEFNALPRVGLDVAGPGIVQVTDRFDDGVYYVAVSDFNLATHLPHYIVHGETRTLAGAVDFPGAAVCGSDVTGLDIQLEVGWGPGPLTHVATKTSPYEIIWFRFEIGTGQDVSTFCHGDGSLVACPNLNDAPLNSGMGCTNSTGRGATLLYFAHNVWSSRITLEDLPPFATVLMFVGPQVAAPTPMGAGVLCIGPGAVRVGPTMSDLSGVATLIVSGGLGMAGTTVYAQAAYRDSSTPNFNFTSGLVIRL